MTPARKGCVLVLLAAASCSGGGALDEPAETVKSAILEQAQEICLVGEVQLLRCPDVPIGSPVKVDLLGGVDATDPGGLTFTFPNVTAAGVLHAVDFGATTPSPSAFVLTAPGLTPAQAHFWTVRTDAEHDSPVEVCVHYDPTWFSGLVPESSLQLLHSCSTSTSLCNIRTSLNTSRNIICGEVDTLAAVSADTGVACDSGDQCATGFCVDGVCCESACGGDNANDCRACAIATGATDDGTCSLLPHSHVCRPSAGICDAAESCTGNSAACPADKFAAATKVCRPAVDTCDADEFCTSSSADCPADVLKDAGTTCYTRQNLCASVEAQLVCDGNFSSCPSPTAWGADACVSASSGTTVTVDLAGGSDTDGGVTLTFSNAGQGDTALVASGTGCPPPTGFQVLRTGQMQSTGAYWNVDTTMSYSGNILICLGYDQGSMAEGGALEKSLRIVHGTSTACDGTGWTTLTTQSLDMANNVICAYTPSLSPFAIVAPIFFYVPDAIVAYAPGTAGAAVTYSPPDADYFVGGERPVACLPPPGSTFPSGESTVTCTTSDAGGDATAASFTVWVEYQAPTDGTFFQQPINPDGSSIFKLGSTVPVKFKLTGGSAGITNLAAHLSIAKVSSSVTGTYVEAASTSAANTGDTFRYDATTNQYVFNLSTKGLTAGTWSLRADLGDLVDHVVQISLR